MWIRTKRRPTVLREICYDSDTLANPQMKLLLYRKKSFVTSKTLLTHCVKKNPFDSHENWEFWYFDKDLSTIYTNVFQGQFYVRYHHPLLQWVQIKPKWAFLILFWSIFFKNFHQLWYFDSINNLWKWRSMKINCYFRINFSLLWCLLWQIESLFELDR